MTGSTVLVSCSQGDEMTRRRLIWISVALLPVGAYLGLAAVGGQLYYPVPSTESTFIHNYSADRVINEFRSNSDGNANTSGMGTGAAGKTYVTYERKVEHRFVVPEDKTEALMTALDEDAQNQIEGSGAEIMGHAGSAVKGYHFSYRTGQIIGSLTIGPPRDRPLDLPESKLLTFPWGLRSVELSIKAEEHWFPEK
jgi:hypothetical protein